MSRRLFSFRRFLAVVNKEFIQMRRDRVTFAMMIGIPLLQLILFGYAINSDPRRLPTAVLSADNSAFSRAIVAAMQTSRYYQITRHAASRDEARDLLDRGKVQFVLTIPQDFGADVLRGERPVLLLEADASDPAAVSGPVGALREIVNRAVNTELDRAFPYVVRGADPVDVRVHADYNPEAVTQYNIVPGLLGVILTMTLTMITALAITRESERGTMENLLATPVRPLEVMLGKIVPYILVGYLQMGLIVVAAKALFQVPMQGSVVLVFLLSLVFIGANLSVGVTLSTLARNQLQAVQMSVFFFLPSMLLSGFMFPFRGMPGWAQGVGSILPLTHYLRLVRGVLLKGNGLVLALDNLWPIALFWLVVIAIGVKRYRKTLD
jgi:ABC-2 type transport system permease protein